MFRQAGLGRAGGLDLERAFEEDVVDADQRPETRARGLGGPAVGFQLGVSQTSGELTVHFGAWAEVQVAAQNYRLAAVGMTQPVRTKQRFDLRLPLSGQQSQMRVQHLHLVPANHHFHP